ncbi:MAG: translocation/assembly module TamB, partial [Cytophagales bacterium]|nr:translocation/assembly module TamB [Cytophagales bacterium]
DNILITANISTDDGTRMFLPLSKNESVSRQNFITFVSKKQKDSSATTVDANKKIEIDSSRIRIDFEIEMTKDAYCEIIFDKKSGDIIRGYGNGLLRMNMDTKGEFTMYGNYTISQGAYNFTMLNIINKGFTIKPGSRVSWNGDPLNAQLDITAFYTQNVSLMPILPVDTAAMNKNSAFTRRYPTVINLNLRGNMLKPDISYGLEIKDYPTNIDNYPIDLYVKAFLASLQSNEQEMNKQVFSLLVLKSFLSNTDSRFTNLSQSAFGSVSELVSNQLNNWLSQVDENLQIDIDLNGLDRNALNAMRMRLSYSLLQGRLRITRDGGFTNTKNQASTYAVLGEWTVEYLLTKDGILRLKMFNKNNPNAEVTALDANSNGFAGGFSLLHTQSFDNLNDLFKKKEKEEEKNKSKAAQQINKDIINK